MGGKKKKSNEIKRRNISTVTQNNLTPEKELVDNNSVKPESEPSQLPELVKSKNVTVPQLNNKFIFLYVDYSVYIAMLIMVIFMAILTIYEYKTENSDKLIPIEQESINVSREISRLLESFPKQQEETWKRLSIGISNVEEMVEPAIFFMVQWKENETSKNPAFEIAKAAGMIAAKYLGNVTDTASPIVLTEEHMRLSHHGLLISLYKEELEARRVMIIQKIEKVAGHIAQGLRYICDEHNPLVNRSAIFIILNAEGCVGVTKNDILEASTSSLITHSETCLTNLWGGENGLGPDILMPLLARIINSAIKIMPENESVPVRNY